MKTLDIKEFVIDDNVRDSKYIQVSFSEFESGNDYNVKIWLHGKDGAESMTVYSGNLKHLGRKEFERAVKFIEKIIDVGSIDIESVLEGEGCTVYF